MALVQPALEIAVFVGGDEVGGVSVGGGSVS